MVKFPIDKESFRRIRALIIKEFYQIIRDPSSILISVGLPLILLFMYGYGVSLDANHVNIGVVVEDSSPAAASFVNTLTGSRFFNVTLGRDRREFDQMIMEGKIRGIVVIPSYFSAFKDRQETKAPIQVIADGSEPNTANFVQNYVQAAWQNWLQQEQLSSKLTGLPLVRTQSRYWFNPELQSRYFLIPGSMGIIMTLIGTLLTALVVSREWERGTMEAMMSTPVSILELLTGKLIPYFVLAMCSMTVCVVIATFFYEIPLRGSWLTLALVTAVFLFPALGLGLMISTLAKDQIVAAQAALVVGFLPAFILSGFIFEISSMPYPIQLLTYMIPARYFVACLHTIFLVGNIWPLIFSNLIPLLMLGSLFLFITANHTAKRLD